MNLRPYQSQAVYDFENSQAKNVCLQIPTGGGKTFIFCEIARRFFVSEVKKVLILVHRVELLKQAKASLGERCFDIADGVKQIPNNFDFYVGMVETVKRRLNKLPFFGLVIIDEVHFANFRRLPFFEDKNTKVLGVTATPLSNPPLSNLFNELIKPIDISNLIEQGYLLNAEAYGVASDLVSVQKFKTKGGDFDNEQLSEFYSSEKMVKNVVNAYWDKIKGKKTIIFNVNIQHNWTVFNALKNEGLNVYAIDGQTSKKERDHTIDKFKKESDAIICNVGILNTGFDEPSVEVIVLNRATKSLPLYLQMIGRGSRLHKNKDKFIIIDLGKNTSRLGYYDDFRDWGFYFKNGNVNVSSGNGVAPIKECPKCNFIQPIRKLVCANCGHSFEEEKKKQEQSEREQKLYLLIKNNPVNVPTKKIFSIAEERKWKNYAVLHKIAEHIVSYQNKYKDIVTNEYCNSIAMIELDSWCKKYGKKNNKWHKEFILKLIHDKREPNPSPNIPMV